MDFSINVANGLDTEVINRITSCMQKFVDQVYNNLHMYEHLTQTSARYPTDIILYFYSDRKTYYPLSAVDSLADIFQGIDYCFTNNEQLLAVEIPSAMSQFSNKEDAEETIALKLAFLILRSCYRITDLDDDYI